MDIRFDYKKEDKCYFGDVFRPMAQVSIKAKEPELWIDTWMIVDTGADFSILPRYFVDDLGISLENDCIPDTTIGVGGTQTIYLCKNKIDVKVGNIERNIPLAFFDNDEVPPLLGRLGFLETFDTEFLKSHVVVFKAH